MTSGWRAARPGLASHVSVLFVLDEGPMRIAFIRCRSTTRAIPFLTARGMPLLARISGALNTPGGLMPRPSSRTTAPPSGVSADAETRPAGKGNAAVRPARAASTGAVKGPGRERVVIEDVQPCIDGGRFAIKRTVGESIIVEADIYADGHDMVAAMLSWRGEAASDGREAPSQHILMQPIPHGNDRWRAEFRVSELGHCQYTVSAWVDRFGTWRRDTQKKLDAGQDVTIDLLAGAELVEEAAQRARDVAAAVDARELDSVAMTMRSGGDPAVRARGVLTDTISALVFRHAERHFATTMERPLRVWVDRERARFSTWYELFPRSASAEPGKHGTFRDVEKRLPQIAQMGFDILYLPPIHPIGRAFRKGKNNTLTPGPEDVGSPWAIGCIGEGASGSGDDGGHKSIHRDLGTMKDFEHLIAAARGHGLEIALDIAYQCSPDHPYVRDHPEWFRKRPDGTIKYAENPPKKYQDIYPFDFESPAWESLWEELKSIVEFWIDRGVKVFRVDNPHTKALPFWEWMIADIRRKDPEVIFLSEAFTRPKVMYRLAKAGFTQSYTYFAWKNQAWEIEQYWRELAITSIAEYFRPNAWPNTPDILNEYLQNGGHGAYMARLVLAATLCASYGIYGPPFEQMASTPRDPGSEEYLDSEKYQLRHWDVHKPNTFREFIARVNRIRRGSPALQHDRTLRFHKVDNPEMVCYSKISEDGEDLVLCVVNTDPFRQQWGTVDLDMPSLGMEWDQKYQVHDMLTDAHYLWHGPRNYVGLDPASVPAHIFRIKRQLRSEHDFETYM
jgi:starch synthase (maltosyl-transferring)